jgi:hypothetical protein
MESNRSADPRLTPDAAEFVRFCYRRRSVGWPDLYDEMCLVASRCLFRGWGPAELADHGIGFGLFDLPALASLTTRIVTEEHESRRTGIPTATVVPAAQPVVPAAQPVGPAARPVGPDRDLGAHESHETGPAVPASHPQLVPVHANG